MQFTSLSSSRLLFVLTLPLATAACIDLEDLFGEAPECERNSDCDDDEECDDGECVEEEDDDEGEEGEGEGDPEPDPEGPQYLQFSTNITELNEDDSVIITAVLTDPDGVDDIIGGSLLDPGGATYGAFQTSAAEGSYELTLTWDEINTVGAIDFNSSLDRQFQARFFDVAGHEAIRTFTLTLACDGGGPACDGSCGGARCGDDSCTFQTSGVDENGNGICGNLCTDLLSSDNCGECANSCGAESCLAVGGLSGENDFFCTCAAGTCASTDVCLGGILQGTTERICFQGGNPRLSGTTPVMDFASPIGSSRELCDLSAAEVSRFCQNEGFEGGTALSTTIGEAFAVDCAGASTFLDCVFTLDTSCDIPSVECSDEPSEGEGEGEGEGGTDFSCTDGAVGSATSGTFTGTTTGAVDDFSSACSSSQGPDVIYRWTPPTTASYTIDTENSTYDTVLAIFTTDCAAGTEIVCDDDGGVTGSNSLITTTLTGGVEVLIVVDTFNGTTGAYTLNIQQN